MLIELTVKEIDLILDVIHDWYIEWADTLGRRQKDRDLENLVRKLDDYKDDYKEDGNADSH